ncbi:MAG TPA: inositol monophosphatase family protein [Candidatus Dormibacteraeota bacterium]|nr:inositol monophosphatase family protein [Candidatus Dormibacteraeota bacterium]
MAAAVAEAVAGVAGTEHGREPLEIGAGGDRTSVVDKVAEDAVVEACERLHARGAEFLLRSEELGDRRYGADLPIVIVDPVDGSKNAMAGLPYFCTSIALLDGPTIGSAAVGVVRSLAGPGSFSAVRGAGAVMDGRPLQPLSVALTPGGRIPVLVLEGPHRAIWRGIDGGLDLVPLLRSCVRVRLLGASALSLCQVARGSASALVAVDGMRSFDCAAGLLILAEAGATVTTLDGGSIAGASAGFGVRSPLVASLSTAVHRRVVDLLGDGDPTAAGAEIGVPG